MVSIHVLEITYIDNLLIRLDEKAYSLILNDQITVSDYLDQFHALEANYIEKILDIDAKNQEVIKIKTDFLKTLIDVPKK